MSKEFYKIDSLSFDPANARKHSEKNLAAIKGSLKKFGQQKPIVIDKNNVVVAGNGTLAAAKALGWEEIWAVRTELTGPEAIAFALPHNRTAELAEWDIEPLTKTLQSLKDIDFDLGAIGFDADFMEAHTPTVENPGLTDHDEVPENVETRCKPGDLWILGNHRLLCGDSTNVQHVERLMGGKKADMVFTDPPYGVAVNNGQGSIKGDEDLRVFIDCLPILKLAAKADAHFYVFCAAGDVLPQSIWEFSKVVPFQNLLPIRCTHENKRGPKGAFKLNYEVCLFGNDNSRGFNSSKKFPVSETTLSDDRYKGDGFLKVYPALWDGERATEHNMNIVHPTQKKVEMIEFYLEISSKDGDGVLDLFGGSGSTLIACEKTGRKCYGMEIDPHYCDVIIKRWEDFTGKKAVLSPSTAISGENSGK